MNDLVLKTFWVCFSKLSRCTVCFYVRLDALHPGVDRRHREDGRLGSLKNLKTPF